MKNPLSSYSKGLTQAELAEKLNTTKQTIGKYENQVVTNLLIEPHPKNLQMRLTTTPAYLMGWGRRKPAAKKRRAYRRHKNMHLIC
ncbi:MAG: helix-turn-helix transcriptional regulator [Oscillospiraceae bacterium]